MFLRAPVLGTYVRARPLCPSPSLVGACPKPRKRSNGRFSCALRAHVLACLCVCGCRGALPPVNPLPAERARGRGVFHDLCGLWPCAAARPLGHCSRCRSPFFSRTWLNKCLLRVLRSGSGSFLRLSVVCVFHGN